MREACDRCVEDKANLPEACVKPPVHKLTTCIENGLIWFEVIPSDEVPTTTKPEPIIELWKEPVRTEPPETTQRPGNLTVAITDELASSASPDPVYKVVFVLVNLAMAHLLVF